MSSAPQQQFKEPEHDHDTWDMTHETWHMNMMLPFMNMTHEADLFLFTEGCALSPCALPTCCDSSTGVFSTTDAAAITT